MTRRFFSGALATALIWPWLRLYSKSETRHNSEQLDGMLNLLVGDTGAARIIGERYLQVHSEDRDINRLLVAILDKTRFADAQAMANQLLQRREADFVRGRVVFVAGWLLSLTEARVCALAAFRSI